LSATERTATLASAAAGPDQRRVALILLSATAILTAFLLPVAHLTWTGLPGFMLMNQTALVIAYTLSAWVLFEQFRRGRSLSLLLAAAGTLYTAAIVALQLASLPGVFTGGRLLGSSPETATWLWTFWHLGPPLVGLASVGAPPWLVRTESTQWLPLPRLLPLPWQQGPPPSLRWRCPGCHVRSPATAMPASPPQASVLLSYSSRPCRSLWSGA
jgi:hypothetical protein